MRCTKGESEGRVHLKHRPSLKGALLAVMLLLLTPVFDVRAEPSPSLGSSATSYGAFPGETITVCFQESNEGDANGFRPVLELIIPGGIEFRGASFLGMNVGHSAHTIPDSGELTYSIGLYQRTVHGQPGAEVIVLKPLVDNIPPGESIPDVCVDLRVSEDAVIGQAYLVNSTLIFAYGSDPLDNPNVDPPQESDTVQIAITPSLIKVRKELGPGI